MLGNKVWGYFTRAKISEIFVIPNEFWGWIILKKDIPIYFDFLKFPENVRGSGKNSGKVRFH